MQYNERIRDVQYHALDMLLFSLVKVNFYIDKLFNIFILFRRQKKSRTALFRGFLL